ncbi:MAG TPA: hypothetical protein VIM44_06750 [Rariglobus sp.]
MSKPLSEVKDEFLINRTHALLKGGHLHGGNRLAIRPEISKAIRVALAEVEKRGLSAKIKMPDILHGSDPLPDYPDGKLFRYLDDPFLEDFLKGEISFRLARSLKEDAHEGRRDNEMERSFHRANGNITIDDIEYASTDFIVTQPIGIEYHMLCLSVEKSRKLARDFTKKGMGFVVIHDVPRFLDMIEEAIRRKYPNAYFVAGAVTYFDALSETERMTKIFDEAIKLKEIHYFYQQEYRVAVADTDCAEERLNVSINPPAGMMEIERFS